MMSAILWRTTSSPTGLTQSSRRYSDRKSAMTSVINQFVSQGLTMLTQPIPPLGTGGSITPSLGLRIRLLAVHAGPSPLQLLLRELMPFRQDNFFHSQNSSGYLASRTKRLMVIFLSLSLVATVAMEETTMQVTHMPWRTMLTWSLRMTGNTRWQTAPANTNPKNRQIFTSRDTMMSLETVLLTWKLHLLLSPSKYQLTPRLGSNTTME